MYDYKSCCNDVYLWLGLAALVVGAVFLLEGLGYIPEGTSSFVWPALMVLVGIKLILLGSTKTDCCNDESCEMPEMMSMPAKKNRPAKRSTKKK